jgi:hypothetical protein
LLGVEQSYVGFFRFFFLKNKKGNWDFLQLFYLRLLRMSVAAATAIITTAMAIAM